MRERERKREREKERERERYHVEVESIREIEKVERPIDSISQPWNDFGLVLISQFRLSLMKPFLGSSQERSQKT